MHFIEDEDRSKSELKKVKGNLIFRNSNHIVNSYR